MATVKTAISIDSKLFKKVEQLSSKFKLSRSQIFSQAVEFFITRSSNLELLKKINQAYSDLDPNDDEAYLRQAKSLFRKKVADKW